MANSAELKKNGVLRFSKVARLAHWSHTVTFMMLALTGLIIYVNSFAPLAVIFGGMQGVRIVHRIMAIGFILLPPIFAISNPKGFKVWMKAITSWTKNDVLFITGFPKEFFGGHVEAPPQGQFNGGEKINSLLTVIGSTTLAITGLIMWAGTQAPAALVRVAIPIHDLAFILTFTTILGHIYMSLGLPTSRHAINGMLSGYVSKEFAQSQYPLWYEKIKNDQA